MSFVLCYRTMKTHGTINLCGHKLPLLVPPWVLAFGIEIARSAPERPGDRERFIKWAMREEKREKQQNRLEAERKRKARTVFKVCR